MQPTEKRGNKNGLLAILNKIMTGGEEGREWEVRRRERWKQMVKRRAEEGMLTRGMRRGEEESDEVVVGTLLLKGSC